MQYYNFSNAYIHRIVTHYVGRRLEEEGVHASAGFTEISDGAEPLVQDYFVQGLNEELAYRLSHSIELEMNPVWKSARNIFKEEAAFIPESVELAEALYESQLHPNVRSGAFHVVWFKGIQADDELIDAIGLYKSDQDSHFLKMLSGGGQYRIGHERGYGLKSLDKGCLILNQESAEGYQVILLDKLSRSTNAKYWTEDFLQLNIIQNEYHVTDRFLNLAHGYVQEKLPEEFDVEKIDRMSLLQKSLQYFNDNDKMVKADFEQTVFEDPSVIESFQDYSTSRLHDMDPRDLENFDISPYAVRKKSGIFKSVLKLDKNFHIYIHGNRNMIEKGVDEEGKKFYKVYYDQES